MKREKHFTALGIREKTILATAVFLAVFILVMTFGIFITEDQLMVDLEQTFIQPGSGHLFGTDWVGRDMLLRTLKGLSISMRIGLLSSLISAAAAALLGILGPVFGGIVDKAVSWLIDFVLAVPHTIIIILISLACGGGLKGIVVGITCTHWTSLTRVIRAEVLQILNAEYTQLSRQFGKSRWYIAREHMFPHIIPQLVVGVVLVFPHAILHEASITFLGFGLPAHEPAIGVILSESMKYLTSGKWWLAFFPGLCLVLISLMVDRIGKNLEKLLDSSSAHN
ncbi:MAG: ABC transporter permease [Lachnospiraceae bacterium]|nr:ABC transporter permease [Lachnospiraceae bacterium]MCI9357298.1 ABC transporter permease [Lachnospiraceae bacterium]